MHPLFHLNGFIAHCAGFIKITGSHVLLTVLWNIIRRELILAAQKFFNLPLFKCAAVICTVFRVNIPIVLPGDHAVFIVIRQLFLNLRIISTCAQLVQNTTCHLNQPVDQFDCIERIFILTWVIQTQNRLAVQKDTKKLFFSTIRVLHRHEFVPVFFFRILLLHGFRKFFFDSIFIVIRLKILDTPAFCCDPELTAVIPADRCNLVGKVE